MTALALALAWAAALAWDAHRRSLQGGATVAALKADMERVLSASVQAHNGLVGRVDVLEQRVVGEDLR